MMEVRLRRFFRRTLASPSAFSTEDIMGNFIWVTGNTTFDTAAAAAESVRQGAVAAATATFVTAGFTPAAFPAFKAAIVAADVAYFAAIATAAAATQPPALPNVPKPAIGIPNEQTSQFTSTVTSQV
jgi:hypothetical protein